MYMGADTRTSLSCHLAGQPTRGLGPRRVNRRSRTGYGQQTNAKRKAAGASRGIVAIIPRGFRARKHLFQPILRQFCANFPAVFRAKPAAFVWPACVNCARLRRRKGVSPLFPRRTNDGRFCSVVGCGLARACDARGMPQKRAGPKHAALWPSPHSSFV